MPSCQLMLVAFFLSHAIWGHTAAIDTQDIGSFWQITDIHWDHDYALDGDAAHMCHRPGLQEQQQPTTDLHRQQQQQPASGGAGVVSSGQQDSSNGQYGNYLCDAPWALVQDSLDAMQHLQSNPDFILWTGDMSPHVKGPRPSFAQLFKALTNVTAEIRSRFPSPLPLLPVLGNHDSVPKNQFPDCPAAFFKRYLTEGGWANILTRHQQQSFARGGYYAYHPRQGLTVAILNTNLYYVANHQGTGDVDPCHQMAWLAGLLNGARDEGNKVMIVAHSPPGFFERLVLNPFFNETYNRAYLDVVAEYGDVIHSHIYGHLHTDSFRIMEGRRGVHSVAFLAPAVTPWKGAARYGGTSVNPALRLYSYDAASVVDYVQYYLNLTLANQGGGGVRDTGQGARIQDTLQGAGIQDTGQGVRIQDTTEGAKSVSDASNVEGTTVMADSVLQEVAPSNLYTAKWKVYYKARYAYSLQRLDIVNMQRLYNDLRTDDDLFSRYYERNSVGYDNGYCDRMCRKTQLCAIRYQDTKSALLCMEYNRTYLEQIFYNIHPDGDVKPLLKYLHEDTTEAQQSPHQSEIESSPDGELPIIESDVMLNMNTVGGSTTAPAEANINDHPGTGGSVGAGFNVPIVVMIGIVGFFWLLLAVMFAALRWRRRRTDIRTSLLAGRGTEYRGYNQLINSN